MEGHDSAMGSAKVHQVAVQVSISLTEPIFCLLMRKRPSKLVCQAIIRDQCGPKKPWW